MWSFQVGEECLPAALQPEGSSGSQAWGWEASEGGGNGRRRGEASLVGTLQHAVEPRRGPRGYTLHDARNISSGKHGFLVVFHNHNVRIRKSGS